MASLNARIRQLLDQEAEKRLQQWREKTQSKKIWHCSDKKRIHGDRYQTLIDAGSTHLLCCKKECLKGHRCIKLYPPIPQKVIKADRPACGAKTRAGGKCKATVVHGKSKCRMHGGLSTGPRSPEGKAAIIASNKRRALVRRNQETGQQQG